MNPVYTSELTVEQYELLLSLLPPESETGRPRTVNMMQVIQGILYVLMSGCAWRSIPERYPTASTIYYYCCKWRDDGSWKRINDRLVAWVRVIADKDASPSAASLDSQTVPTAVMVTEAVGFDAGKKLKGRKRFTLVDTLGLLLMVKVVAADTPERSRCQAITLADESRTRSRSSTS